MPNSATRANDPGRSELVNACAAAADELAATRRLAAALERENIALRDRIDTASQMETALKELNDSRQKENSALRAAITAKDETVAAKDAVIAKQDELILQLKKRRSSAWKRLGDILIGVAISTVLN